MRSVMFLIWVVDALVKVFPNTLPPEKPETAIRIECARNEYESGQFVFRCEKDVKQLEVRVGALKRDGGEGSIAPQNLRARFVGMVRVENNVPNTPPAQLAIQAPADIPDVLKEDRQTSVPANTSQPVWVTVYVPKETPAGLYKGSVEIEADGVKRTLPLEVTVDDFEIPDTRHMFVTNWFHDSAVAKYHHVELWSDDFFKILEAYTRNLAAHRQNVFWVPWRLIEVTRESDGKLSFDDALFDRYIETFLAAGGFDRIEIQFVGRFEKDWNSKEIVPSTVEAKDRETGKRVKLGQEEGLGAMLEHLQKHLEEKGWLERSMIHVADEASMTNIESWRKLSEFVHRHAPKLRRIDAIETVGYDGALEVWVPKLNHLYHWYPWFQRAQAQGAELWFYVCLFPRGYFMNRLTDMPLIEARLLHWLNARYGLAGYLHWGLNAWRGDPFGPQALLGEKLPAGDAWVIYPGKDGPLDSIRWEAERDGIEDFELFTLLEARLKETAEKLGSGTVPSEARGLSPSLQELSAQRVQELCRRMVGSFTDYQTSVTALRETRAALAREIEQAAAEPWLVWGTLPDETTPLVADPPSPVIVFGAADPGTSLTLNGKPVELGPDGRFLTAVSASTRKPQFAITLEATKDGASQKQTRTLAIRK